MKFIDDQGNELKEGDRVSVGLGLAQSVVGTIVKIDSGLGLQQTTQGAQPAQPTLHVAVPLSFNVFPNGMVLGLHKIAAPDPTGSKLVN